MAKQKEQIEEAVVIEESTSILVSNFKAPELPKLVDRATSIVTIQESLKTYSDIEITGVKDKVNYDLVAKGMKKFKDDRIAWKKAVTENLSEPVAQWLADTKLDITAIENEFKSAETTLREKKDAIDTLKKEEKEKADAEKLRVVTQRIETIVNLGGKSDGVRYLFDYDITLFITIASLKDLDDKKWKNALQEIQDAYDYEQKRISDLKILEIQLAEANSAKELELKIKQRKLRIKELTLDGFSQDTDGINTFLREDGKEVTIAVIDQYTDQEWDELILSFQYSESEIELAKDENGNEIPIDASDIHLPTLNIKTFESVGSFGFPSVNPKPVIPDIDYKAGNNEDLPFFDEPKIDISTTGKTGADVFISDLTEQPKSRARDVTFAFDDATPFIEFPMGEGYIQRIYHVDFEDYALEMLPTQEIAMQGDVDFDNLKFVFIAVS